MFIFDDYKKEKKNQKNISAHDGQKYRFSTLDLTTEITGYSFKNNKSKY